MRWRAFRRLRSLEVISFEESESEFESESEIGIGSELELEFVVGLEVRGGDWG